MKIISTPKFWQKKYHLFTILLLPFSFIYYLITHLNKLNFFFYNNSKIKVVCVGNLFLGGTGKTPLVKKLYDSLKNEKKCCILKKYRQSQIDEINLLKQDSEIITPRNRVVGLKDASNKGYEIIILDDGMQDYSFKKHISILCIKSDKGFGNEMILPAGPLRETLKSIKKYNIAVINGHNNENLNNLLLKYNPSIKIFYSSYKIKNIKELKEKRFIAFSGIADNKSFFNLLKKNNIEILEKIEFKDHHYFSESDMKILIKKGREKNLQLITTDKNYNNINKKYRDKIYYTKLDLEINNYNNFLNEIN